MFLTIIIFRRYLNEKLSIVVPCYNEQETIYPFLEETQKVESKMRPIDF